MGMRMGDLDRWARAHHGVISMEASGLTRSSWYRAIRSGQLDQLHPGVARLHGTADTAEQRIAAAVLAVGMPALASHRSAARLWGIERPTGDPVDVIVAGRRRLPALRGVVIHRPKDLERLSPPQRRSNIVCTNILRTLLDLGAVDRAAVPDAVGHAIAHHHITLPTLESVVIQHSAHGRAGIVALRNAVDAWAIDSKPTDSLLETAMQRLIDRCRLPPVEFHPIVCGHQVDFRVIGTPVILECDGWAYHGLQRKTFESDRARDADLIGAGWIVVRFTYRAITVHPKPTADRIAAAVARWG
jgi:very-short-patch-repair endonuclease